MCCTLKMFYVLEILLVSLALSWTCTACRISSCGLYPTTHLRPSKHLHCTIKHLSSVYMIYWLLNNGSHCPHVTACFESNLKQNKSISTLLTVRCQPFQSCMPDLLSATANFTRRRLIKPESKNGKKKNLWNTCLWRARLQRCMNLNMRFNIYSLAL